jgi:hypothetical protein
LAAGAVFVSAIPLLFATKYIFPQNLYHFSGKAWNFSGKAWELKMVILHIFVGSLYDARQQSISKKC